MAESDETIIRCSAKVTQSEQTLKCLFAMEYSSTLCVYVRGGKLVAEFDLGASISFPHDIN